MFIGRSALLLSLQSNYTQRTTNSQSGVIGDSQINGRNTAVVPGVSLSRGHALPPVTLLWWSSKTIRRAERKRLEARAGGRSAAALPALEALAD